MPQVWRTGMAGRTALSGIAGQRDRSAAAALFVGSFAGRSGASQS
jgi:hypothetical protein